MTITFVFMAGLPGTGKSTLAAALAEAVGGFVLSKDKVRATLFPGALTEYSEPQDDFCFRALLEAAKYVARGAQPSVHASERLVLPSEASVPTETCAPALYIFFDGRTFRKRTQVEDAVNAAQDAGCGYRILYLTCPDHVALARIASDQRAFLHPAANRDQRLYLASKSAFQAITYPCLSVDTSAPLAACLQRCLTYLGKPDATAAELFRAGADKTNKEP